MKGKTKAPAGHESGRKSPLKINYCPVEDVRKYFPSNPEAARQEVMRMAQRDLQAKFKLVFQKQTFSNNNVWMRRKLLEAAGLETGKAPRRSESDGVKHKKIEEKVRMQATESKVQKRIPLDPGTKPVRRRSTQPAVAESAPSDSDEKDLSGDHLRTSNRARKPKIMDVIPSIVNAKVANETPGAAAIGRKLKVFWPEEKDFFIGTVKGYCPRTGEHHIVYKDGDEEYVILACERIEWLTKSAEGTGEVPAATRQPEFASAGKSAVAKMPSTSGNKKALADLQNPVKDKARPAKVMQAALPNHLLTSPPMPHAVQLAHGIERFGRATLKGGEFVWGKVKGHGFWPGKVATPHLVRSGVEKNLTRGMAVGLVLVNFFDGQYAWCVPDTILPFAAHFNEFRFSKKNTLFTEAVQKAEAEFKRAGGVLVRKHKHKLQLNKFKKRPPLETPRTSPGTGKVANGGAGITGHSSSEGAPAPAKLMRLNDDNVFRQGIASSDVATGGEVGGDAGASSGASEASPPMLDQNAGISGRTGLDAGAPTEVKRKVGRPPSAVKAAEPVGGAPSMAGGEVKKRGPGRPPSRPSTILARLHAANNSTSTSQPSSGVKPHSAGPNLVGRPPSNPVGRPPSHSVRRPSLNPVGRPPSNPVGRPPSKLVGRPHSNPVGRPPSNPVGRPPSNPVGRPPSNPVGRPPSNPVGRPSSNPVGRPPSNPDGRPQSSSHNGRSGNPVGRPPRIHKLRPNAVGRPSNAARAAAAAAAAAAATSTTGAAAGKEGGGAPGEGEREAPRKRGRPPGSLSRKTLDRLALQAQMSQGFATARGSGFVSRRAEERARARAAAKASSTAAAKAIAKATARAAGKQRERARAAQRVALATAASAARQAGTVLGPTAVACTGAMGGSGDARPLDAALDTSEAAMGERRSKRERKLTQAAAEAEPPRKVAHTGAHDAWMRRALLSKPSSEVAPHLLQPQISEDTYTQARVFNSETLQQEEAYTSTDNRYHSTRYLNQNSAAGSGKSLRHRLHNLNTQVNPLLEQASASLRRHFDAGQDACYTLGSPPMDQVPVITWFNSSSRPHEDGTSGRDMLAGVSKQHAMSGTTGHGAARLGNLNSGPLSRRNGGHSSDDITSEGANACWEEENAGLPDGEGHDKLLKQMESLDQLLVKFRHVENLWQQQVDHLASEHKSVNTSSTAS